MKLNTREKIQKQSIEVTDSIEGDSFSLIHLLGYILLLFSLIDYVAIFFPPHLLDPKWEFQTSGMLVDHVWAPLLGLVLVFFYTKKQAVSPIEKTILQCLSWLSLLLGLAYILMLPLGISDSLTIYFSNNNQITHQVGQQTETLQKLQQQVNTANTLDQLKAITKVINPQGNTQLKVSPEKLKTKISQQIQTSVKNLSAAAEVTQRQQSIQLLKEAVRVNLGALLSGVCLITIWNWTRWVRIAHKYVN